MPHNNRVSGSSALKTNDIWSKTIGYDPYANTEEDRQCDDTNQTASLMLLAKMTNLSGVESRGGCKKCGMLGHLTFQCRNAVGAPVNKNVISSTSSSDSDCELSQNDAIESGEYNHNKSRKRSRPRESDDESSTYSFSTNSSYSDQHRSKANRKSHSKKSKKSKKEKKSKDAKKQKHKKHNKDKKRKE